MPNKFLFMRTGSYSLSHSRFSPLLAVPSVHSVGLLPRKRSVKLCPVLNLPDAVRKEEDTFLEILEMIQADNIRE